MIIDAILSEYRHDFSARMRCEHCDARQLLASGYNDAYYHTAVIPAMSCNSCGKSSNDECVRVMLVEVEK